LVGSKRMELTQEEITELTQAMKTATAAPSAARQVREYDFTRPDKLSKVHLRVLQSLLSGLERHWSVSLSTVLKSESVVKLGNLEQAKFGAYVESQSQDCVAVGLDVEPFSGISIISIPLDLAVLIVDRLAGGIGKLGKGQRTLTPVDRSILKRLINKLAVDLSRVWRSLTDVSIKVLDVHDSVESLEFNSNEMFLITRFNWYISSTDYKVDLVIPGSSFDSVRGLITPERLLSAKSKEEDNYTAGATKMLDPVSINVSVELGKARVSMRDVVEIGVGDVIRLDRSVDNLLEIKVQDKTKFYGRPGMVGNQIAIQITERAQDAPQTAVEQETPEQDVDFGG